MLSDTIAAIATPPGEGGVGIVRVSGPLAPSLSTRLFPRLSHNWESHRLRHGELEEPSSRRVIDSALACLMLAPGTYTGEDVFEIHCHGSPVLLQRVLMVCLAEGCRPANPGEFTLRAFLNGRLDLVQAEAVLDVVRAPSNAALDLSVNQLEGWLSSRLEPSRQKLLGISAQMEAMVDFVEEDVPPLLNPERVADVRAVRAELQDLIDDAAQGIVLREGISLAIVGSPNVGKSSIMNALLGLERSIVTPIAGTTRDTIEESLQVNGIAFRTVDTAGMVETKDIVERLGVDRSLAALNAADIILLVLDRSRPVSSADVDVLETVRATLCKRENEGRPARLVVARNKSDLSPVLDGASVLRQLHPRHVVDTSATELGGVDRLRSALEEAALGGHRREAVVGNVRHRDALQRAASCLDAALEALEEGQPLDMVSLDVRAAGQALGEITGANVDEELLDRIFRDFCIGK